MATLVLQQFTGTKTVKACKMSRKTAEEIIGRKVRTDSDETEDEMGYLVQYPDNYQSWSPTKAFEEAYRVSETHIDRMMIEKEDLEKRYNAAQNFIHSIRFATLTDDQRFYLSTQCDLMKDYLHVLCERIRIENEIMAKNRAADTQDSAGLHDPLDPASEK